MDTDPAPNGPSDVERLMAHEFSLLYPLFPREQLEQVYAFLTRGLLEVVEHEKLGIEGQAPDHSLVVDLEQLQVGDATALFNDYPAAQQLIRTLQDSKLYDADELNFLTLRSLFHLAWEKPSSNDQVKLIAHVEWTMHESMVHLATQMSEMKDLSRGYVPYWARHAQLELSSDLQPEYLDRYGPHRLPCILVRSLDMNAHTVTAAGDRAIAIDYALEPLLKEFNVFSASFYGSREFVHDGQVHLERAASELLPRILYSRGLITASDLTPFRIVFGKESIMRAKHTTYRQISFIMLHELGHLILEHPAERKMFPPARGNASSEVQHLVRDHLLEHEADSFALSALQSAAIASLLRMESSETASNEEGLTEQFEGGYGEYQLQLQAVESLLMVMDLIENVMALVRDAGVSDDGHDTDCHPAASLRWDRLQKLNAFAPRVQSHENNYMRQLYREVVELIAEKDLVKMFDERRWTWRER